MFFINRNFLKDFYIIKRVSVLTLIFVLFFDFCIYANDLGSRTLPFHKGETIEYDIKKFGLKVGEARIVFKGNVNIEGRNSLLIVFTSTAPRFFDEERIYLDPVTYYPIIVKRNLNVFGRRELIREDYSLSEGRVKIVKYVNGQKSKRIIKKNRAMDNIYGFIYRYRKNGKLKIGETLRMFLPTQNINITLVKHDEIWISGEKYETYLLKSVPPQYSIWFTTNGARIPVRIDKARGLKKISMLLRDYKSGQ